MDPVAALTAFLASDAMRPSVIYGHIDWDEFDRMAGIREPVADPDRICEALTFAYRRWLADRYGLPVELFSGLRITPKAIADPDLEC